LPDLLERDGVRGAVRQLSFRLGFALRELFLLLFQLVQALDEQVVVNV
jgi:hypothetical protein